VRTVAHDRADEVIAALLAQARQHRTRGFEHAAVGSEDFAALLAWSAYTPRNDITPLRAVQLKVLHPSAYKVTVAVPLSPHAAAAGHGALFAAPAATADATGMGAGSSTSGDGGVPKARHSTFVLKNECRPAQPYDGQQSLGEIGAALVLETIFGSSGAYGPYGWVNGARGVIVEVAPEQLGQMVAKGGRWGICGLMSGNDLAAAGIHRDRWERLYFIGAALQWNPVHYDDAIPHRDSMAYFKMARLDELRVETAVPALPAPIPAIENVTRNEIGRPPSVPTQDGPVAAPPAPPVRRRGPTHPALASDPAEVEALRQFSDVLVVDFVAQSSDRISHNWFRTAGAVPEIEALVREERQQKVSLMSFGFPSAAELKKGTADKRARFRSGKHFLVEERPQVGEMSTRTSRMLYMDNGWAFAGRAFVYSVCDAETDDLRVPRLLRLYNGTHHCNTDALDLSTCPPPKLERPPWPLCRFRRVTVDAVKSLGARWSGAQGRTGAGARWAGILREDPLVQYLIRRFRDEADVIGGQPFRRGGMQPLNVVLSRFTNGCPRIGSVGITDAIDLLALGVGRRLQALERHVSWCVETYGEDEVLL
jgi:hypothetical protein